MLAFTRCTRTNPAGGAHVANAAFMVPRGCARAGDRSRDGRTLLEEARRLVLARCQFNFVVSTKTNQQWKLWQNLGMKIVATLPGAFRHPEKRVCRRLRHVSAV